MLCTLYKVIKTKLKTYLRKYACTGGNLPNDWTEDIQPVTIEAFNSPSGPTVSIPDSPRDIFNLFFTEELLEKIVEETNRYARQVMGACGTCPFCTYKASAFDKIYVRFCSFFFLQVDRMVWKELSTCSLLFCLCFNSKCDLIAYVWTEI